MGIAPAKGFVMWDAFVRYYGLDWAATAFSLASIYFIGDGRRAGFTLGMAGAVLWAAFGVMASSAAGTLLNVLLFGLFTRGYLKHGRSKPSPASVPISATGEHA
jgi:hypothetical protein